MFLFPFVVITIIMKFIILGDLPLLGFDFEEWEKQPPRGAFKKRYSEKMQQIYKRTPMPKSEACNFIKKEILTQVFSCEFCEIPKKTFFTEHLWTTASQVYWCARQEKMKIENILWKQLYQQKQKFSLGLKCWQILNLSHEIYDMLKVLPEGERQIGIAIEMLILAKKPPNHLFPPCLQNNDL